MLLCFLSRLLLKECYVRISLLNKLFKEQIILVKMRRWKCNKLFLIIFSALSNGITY